MTRRIAAAVAVLALPASPARATDFNGGTIAIPDSGISAPYPSTIAVSGLTRAVGKLTVRVRLMHDLPEDVDAMLVGPQGQGVMLLSDVDAAPMTSFAALRFDDDAASPATDPLATGTFRPTNVDDGNPDVFASPAPQVAPGGALSVFNGTDPNGTWSLYVVDDEPGDAGSISSWTLSFTDARGAQVDWSSPAYSVPEAAGRAAVTVTRPSGVLAGTVNYATSAMSGSASTGADYTAASGTLAFAPGQKSATIAIPIVDDPMDEPDQSFRIELTSPAGDASLGAARFATVTIADDDAPPALSLADVRVPEHSDTGLGEFVVSLSAPSERLVTARLDFAAGTATAGADYTAYPGGFSVAPGLSSVRLRFRVHGDKFVEGDETLTGTLSQPVNATLGRPIATATIADDDKPSPPGVSARMSKRGALELSVDSNFAGVAVARVQISAGGRSARLASPRTRVVAGRTAKLTLHLPPAVRHGHLTVRVAVTVSHGATKQTGRRTFHLRG